jgi:hypothetical protein
MSNNMLTSTNSEHEVHDLNEYAFAKEVVKSHPKIISIYAKILPVLYHFAAYQCVWPVITIIEDSKLLAEMQLEYYSKIHSTKGLVKNGEKRKK